MRRPNGSYRFVGLLRLCQLCGSLGLSFSERDNLGNCHAKRKPDSSRTQSRSYAAKFYKTLTTFRAVWT